MLGAPLGLWTMSSLGPRSESLRKGHRSKVTNLVQLHDEAARGRREWLLTMSITDDVRVRRGWGGSERESRAWMFHRICLRRAVHRHVQSAEHKIGARSRLAHQSRPPGARVARVRPPDDKGPRNPHIACRRDAPARAQVRRRRRFQSKSMRQNPAPDVTHASQDRGQRAARCSRAATCDAAV